ncbi:hypothetical protein D910_09951 [Dendroctonus ponderosae]
MFSIKSLIVVLMIAALGCFMLETSATPVPKPLIFVGLGGHGGFYARHHVYYGHSSPYFYGK